MIDTLRDIIQPKLDQSESRQHNIPSFVKSCEFIDPETVCDVLDLGCGTGKAFEPLSRLFPNLQYCGLDIEVSPEVSKRERSDLEFHAFDGVTIPFEDDKFDAIHCRQVLEHVRHPDAVVKEASRVLKPGGLFIASVSQLEPYHSHSIFNWTPYGIITVFESHGFNVARMAPGIDGITLTLRRILGRENFNGFFSQTGLFNHYLEIQLNGEGKKPWQRNFQKLVVAGHIIFVAQKL